MGEPKPPQGLEQAGEDLWNALTGEYEFEPHELTVLTAACRTADALERLALELSLATTLHVQNARGDSVAHPSVVEQRQQGLALARLLASLRLPAGEESDRPQRRGGARQPYRPRSVS